MNTLPQEALAPTGFPVGALLALLVLCLLAWVAIRDGKL